MDNRETLKLLTGKDCKISNKICQKIIDEIIERLTKGFEPYDLNDSKQIESDLNKILNKIFK